MSGAAASHSDANRAVAIGSTAIGPSRGDSPAEAAAIEIDGLTVHAGRRRVLDVARLRLASGELVGLLGPNGAGKSTLLRCLLGMQDRVRGRITVLGRDVRSLGAAAAAGLRRRIGHVPQLAPAAGETPLTVREVVAIGRTGLAGLLRPLRAEDWRTVDSWIERLGLRPLAGRTFGELSGGERRKALIARAMAQEPELLLLDEPTANLDLGWRERIVELVGELYASMRLTVVLVCHELEVLPACCGRVVVLEGGRVTDDGPPGGVLSTGRIASLYGPGLAVVRSGGRWAVVPGGPAGGGKEAPHA